MAPIRFGALLGGDHEVTELTLGRFDRSVDHAFLGPKDLGRTRDDGAFGEPIETLLNDPDRLAHLFDPHEVPVVGVAVLADGDLEVDLVVTVVRKDLSNVPLDPGAAERGPGQTPVDGLLRRDDPDADGAFLPDPVLGQQPLVLVDLGREPIDELGHLLCPTHWQVERLAAPIRLKHHPRLVPPPRSEVVGLIVDEGHSIVSRDVNRRRVELDARSRGPRPGRIR